MMSSPLRRTLPVSLLLASLTFLPSVTEARVAVPGFTDSAAVVRLEHRGVLERLWSALTHLLGADGIRIDPNGSTNSGH